MHLAMYFYQATLAALGTADWEASLVASTLLALKMDSLDKLIPKHSHMVDLFMKNRGRMSASLLDG